MADASVSVDKDVFDDIVMAEERFHEEGYQEGFTAGQIAGEREGFKMGQDKGKQIGSEYGFYLGFVATWKQLVKKDPGLARPKTVKALDVLHTLLVSFQVENVTYENYWEDFKKIRDKFKQTSQMRKHRGHHCHFEKETFFRSEAVACIGLCPGDILLWVNNVCAAKPLPVKEGHLIMKHGRFFAQV